MGLYQVKVWTVVYVEAETESDAIEVVDEYMHNILQSEAEWEVEPDYEVTSIRDVRHGWDSDCYPYSRRTVKLRTIGEVLDL